MLDIVTASYQDRSGILDVIQSVAHERIYFQTDCYMSTPVWERALQVGYDEQSGILLLAVKDQEKIVGYGRLTPNDTDRFDRMIGNIGLALLPVYRSQGLGAAVLTRLLSYALVMRFCTLTAAVLATNLRSLQLFQKYGFTKYQTHTINVPFERTPVEELILTKYVRPLARSNHGSIFYAQEID